MGRQSQEKKVRIILNAVLMKNIARSVGRPKGILIARNSPLRKLRDFHCWAQMKRN